MKRVVVSKRASEDLLEIWLYIAADNIDAADRLLAEFDAKFLLLGGAPELGHMRTGLQPRVRSFPVGHYLIFYRISGNEIAIIRVVHGARRLQNLI